MNAKPFRSGRETKGRDADGRGKDGRFVNTNLGDGEDRRTYIIKMAALRIARCGFDATSVRQIAEDVKIQSGSLYHHFASKDEILYEIVKDAAALVRDETLRIVSAEAEPETKLVALVLRELGEFVQNHRVHVILYNERKTLRSREEFAEIRTAKQEAYKAWRSLLEAGNETGQFKSTLDPYHTIRTITRMLNSAADWFASDDPTKSTVVQQYTFDEVESFYLEFILGAVRHPVRGGDPIPVEAGRRLAYPPSEP